ncbi:hypothetical protein K7X08_007286 [Anisodus acutangulus]|uniref:PTM/DIR17-like Tudor domain-containing protein n=1 Tax=Anisodus acutangulus TaxID=402998 RepID=A0A9Q1LFE2_9SOLA|nr:hypothetical protein K7X08_007286 [Anisodus acutangulus]
MSISGLIRRIAGNGFFVQRKVKYEDGDVEDLEWHELEQVLRPLDITIPLKTLATKIIKRKQRSIQKSGKSGSKTRNQGIKMTKTW